MNTIDTLRTGIKDLARKQELDSRLPVSPRGQNFDEENPLDRLDQDSVSLAPSSLRRLQASMAKDPALTPDEAQQVLEGLSNTPTEVLRLLHDDLDPARVFALLGMDE